MSGESTARDVVADCSNCGVTAYHEVVDSEAFDGLAYRCTSCSQTKQRVQLTIQSTVHRDSEGGR